MRKKLKIKVNKREGNWQNVIKAAEEKKEEYDQME